jgi:hypothetical protein
MEKITQMHKINTKRINKTIKNIHRIIDLVKSHNLNLTGKRKNKSKKHTPLTPTNNIRYKESILTDDKLVLACGNSKPVDDYFNVLYDENDPLSYSLSERTLDEHKDYILTKLNEYVSRLIMLRDNTVYFGDKKEEVFHENLYFIDVTDKYITNIGRQMYQVAYNLNIYPPIAFIQERNKNIKIATSYVVAIDANNKNLNIFFDSNKNFNQILSKEHTIQNQIFEFNSRCVVENIAHKFWVIYYNLMMRMGTIICGDKTYRKEINKIDELPCLYENNEVCGFGWDVTDFLISDFLISDLKMTINTTTHDNLQFTECSHTINKEENKKLLGI